MIQGEQIILGPLQPIDFDQLYRWSNDPEIARLNENLRPNDWGSQHERWMNAHKDPTRVIFAIRLPTQSNIVGFVQISNIDPINHAAVLGITIGDPNLRGRGLGGEALRLAMDYCWRHLNLSRIALTVFADNKPAIELYRKSGFQKEGLLRRALFIDGRWIDLVIMAALLPKRRNHRKAR
jgi:RimJ/RimL family protein N-acetyltransferase